MGTDKINLLHIYQNSNIGGIQQQILNLLKTYNRELFNPIFCSLRPEGEMGKEVKNLGVDFISLNRPRYYRFSPGILIDLISLMKKRHIHVVRTHKYYANFYGRIAARLAGVPVIIASEHNIYKDKQKRIGRRMINRFLSGITDKFIAVSEAVKRDIMLYDKIDSSKILVMHNGVDTQRFSPDGKFSNIREKFLIKEGSIVLGFVGRLVISKGLEYLIDAISLIKDDYNIKLFIVGDGSLLNELKQKAKKNHIFNRIIFAGERRDIPDILSSIDIFVMPSIKEGLPNSLLEAMSMGKPVIATEIGGIPEIVKNRFNGILVPSRDPRALATAIKELIDDSQLAAKLGEAARNFMLNNFSIEATTQKWQSLYLSTLKEKGLMNNGKI